MSLSKKKAIWLKSSSIINNPILESLIKNDIVGYSASNKTFFKYPDLLGYLASFYSFESATQKTVADLFSWSTFVSYYGFRVSRDANSVLADSWIFEDLPPLFQNLIIIGNWLRHTSPKSSFRLKLIKKLISLIQNNNISPYIRLRFLSIFAFANDASGSLFLKQMLNSVDDQSKTLAALSAAIFPPDDKIHSGFD